MTYKFSYFYLGVFGNIFIQDTKWNNTANLSVVTMAAIPCNSVGGDDGSNDERVMVSDNGSQLLFLQYTQITILIVSSAFS